jgi:nucleoside-diphosphate-sugar epimerase
MTQTTVAVTGGNGSVGRAVISHLADEGYRTVNVNRGKRDESPAHAYVQADLTAPGEVYGALAKSGADAVVHLGMIPTPERHPGHVVFESNATSSYVVLEAAEGLGVDTAVLASSLCAIGAGYEPEPRKPPYLPVDEDVPPEPSTAYGVGKQALEVVASGFGRRRGSPATVVSVRFPWVATDDALRERFVESDWNVASLRDSGLFESTRNSLFSYVHADDAARFVRLSVESDLAGHERFFLSAPDTAVDEPTADLVADHYPGAEVRADFEGYDSLVSTEKASRRLGWEPERSWRDLRDG